MSGDLVRCNLCGRAGRLDEEEVRSAREEFGTDPAAHPDDFALVCQDCKTKIVAALGDDRFFRCPLCGYLNSGEETIALAAPGAVTFCPQCFYIERLNDRMELEVVSPAGLHELKRDHPGALLMLLLARGHLIAEKRARAGNN